MPYAPHTWTDDEIITAALLNNLEAGIQSPPDGAITTAKLATNAATKVTVSSILAASATTVSTTFIDVLTLTVTKDAGTTLVIYANIPHTSTDSTSRGAIALNINGTDYAFGQTGSSTAPCPASGWRIETGLGAGTHTIKLRLRSTGAFQSNINVAVSGGNAQTFLAAIEFKR
jgi:hypothetical protein